MNAPCRSRPPVQSSRVWKPARRCPLETDLALVIEWVCGKLAGFSGFDEKTGRECKIALAPQRFAEATARVRMQAPGLFPSLAPGAMLTPRVSMLNHRWRGG
jgi:hypothetical protein